MSAINVQDTERNYMFILMRGFNILLVLKLEDIISPYVILMSTKWVSLAILLTSTALKLDLNRSSSDMIKNLKLILI
jgi:hypothetical protein